MECICDNISNVYFHKVACDYDKYVQFCHSIEYVTPLIILRQFSRFQNVSYLRARTVLASSFTESWAMHSFCMSIEQSCAYKYIPAWKSALHFLNELRLTATNFWSFFGNLIGSSFIMPWGLTNAMAGNEWRAALNSKRKISSSIVINWCIPTGWPRCHVSFTPSGHK